jgi:hypothetical protein
MPHAVPREWCRHQRHAKERCVPNPDDSTHSIKVADPLDPDATLHILLILRGVTSCFSVRIPSMAKFADDDIPKLNMTYESPEWDPGDPDWATQEASTMNSRGRVYDVDNIIAGGRRFIKPCLHIQAIRRLHGQ